MPNPSSRSRGARGRTRGGRKRPHPSSSTGAEGSGGSGAGSSQNADLQAMLELAADLAKIKHLEGRLEKARAQYRKAMWRRGAKRNARRVSTVSQEELEKWSAVRLECSSKTIRDEAALKAFVASLREAPCLGALELSLGNKGRTRRALRKVLAALPYAPAKIKELTLTFGVTSREDVFALLDRVKGHLEKFSLSEPYQHAVYETPDVLQRFWTALEGTGVTTLELPGSCLNDSVDVNLQPAKWRVESLSVSIGLGAKRTLLPSLIRANAASLRKVKVVGLSLPPDDLKAVFTALAECENLEDVQVPCAKEAALLERCASLTKLSVFGGNLLMAGLFGGTGVDKVVLAVAKMLALPAIVDRVENLGLSLFKLGISKKATLALFKAVRAMRKLKSLSVCFCAGFADELRATLKSLPLLEELHLADGDDSSWRPQVLADITPVNAPSLRSLRLDPDLLGGPRGGLGRLGDAVRAIEQSFEAVGRHLEVLVEKDPPKRSSSSSSSDEEDDDGDTPDDEDDDSDTPDDEDEDSVSDDEDDDDSVSEDEDDNNVSDEEAT